MQMEKITGNVGIYKITNLVNKNKYVGSSKNIIARKVDHFRKLKYNIHDNKHLQNAYNKYGKENFIFEILEITTLNLLLDLEQTYLNHYVNWNTDYNISTSVVKEKLAAKVFNVVNKKWVKLFKKIIKQNTSVLKLAKKYNIKNVKCFRQRFKKYCKVNNIEYKNYVSYNYEKNKVKKATNRIVFNKHSYKEEFNKSNLSRKTFRKYFKSHCLTLKVNYKRYLPKSKVDIYFNSIINEFIMGDITYTKFTDTKDISKRAFSRRLKIYCNDNNLDYKTILSNKDFKFNSTLNLSKSDFINKLKLLIEEGKAILECSKYFNLNRSIIKYYIVKNKLIHK